MPVPDRISRLSYPELLDVLGFHLVDEVGWTKIYQLGDSVVARIFVGFDEWDIDFKDVLAQFKAMEEVLGITAPDVIAAYHRTFAEEPIQND